MENQLLKRELIRLKREHDRVNGHCFIFGVFQRSPETVELDEEIHNDLIRLEKLEKDNPWDWCSGETGAKYQKRINKQFNHFHSSITKKIRILDKLIDVEYSSVAPEIQEKKGRGRMRPRVLKLAGVSHGVCQENIKKYAGRGVGDFDLVRVPPPIKEGPIGAF